MNGAQKVCVHSDAHNRSNFQSELLVGAQSINSCWHYGMDVHSRSNKLHPQVCNLHGSSIFTRSSSGSSRGSTCRCTTTTTDKLIFFTSLGGRISTTLCCCCCHLLSSQLQKKRELVEKSRHASRFRPKQLSHSKRDSHTAQRCRHKLLTLRQSEMMQRETIRSLPPQRFFIILTQLTVKQFIRAETTMRKSTHSTTSTPESSSRRANRGQCSSWEWWWRWRCSPILMGVGHCDGSGCCH